MTVGEFDLLDDLRINGPQTPGELAGYGMTRRSWGGYQTATAALMRLRKRGFVVRGETGIWDLTEKAREVLAL